jgi:hypothetical protein
VWLEAFWPVRSVCWILALYCRSATATKKPPVHPGQSQHCQRSQIATGAGNRTVHRRQILKRRKLPAGHPTMISARSKVLHQILWRSCETRSTVEKTGPRLRMLRAAGVRRQVLNPRRRQPQRSNNPRKSSAEWLTESVSINFKLLIIKHLHENERSFLWWRRIRRFFGLNDVGRRGDDREKLREGLANEIIPFESLGIFEQRVEVQYG